MGIGRLGLGPRIVCSATRGFDFEFVSSRVLESQFESSLESSHSNQLKVNFHPQRNLH